MVIYLKQLHAKKNRENMQQQQQQQSQPQATVIQITYANNIHNLYVKCKETVAK